MNPSLLWGFSRSCSFYSFPLWAFSRSFKRLFSPRFRLREHLVPPISLHPCTNSNRLCVKPNLLQQHIRITSTADIKAATICVCFQPHWSNKAGDGLRPLSRLRNVISQSTRISCVQTLNCVWTAWPGRGSSALSSWGDAWTTYKDLDTWRQCGYDQSAGIKQELRGKVMLCGAFSWFFLIKRTVFTPEDGIFVQPRLTL